MKVTDSSANPVLVSDSAVPGYVELAIEDPATGGIRSATLRPEEARSVAYALLLQAEQVQARSTGERVRFMLATEARPGES
jgi:hypothetical protein